MFLYPAKDDSFDITGTFYEYFGFPWIFKKKAQILLDMFDKLLLNKTPNQDLVLFAILLLIIFL